MTKLYILLCMLLTCVYAFGQTPVQKTITGYIEDEGSREKLLGATAFEINHALGVVSNTYGFFSLNLPVGPVEVHFSYIGFQSQVLRFDLQQDTFLTIRLSAGTMLEEVEVTANRTEHIAESSQMSSVDVPIDFIRKVPALLGEVDILKVIQLLPGVQSGGEGQSGFYVRGGGPDQNLILLDGVPVYNASHLFGFFSVFNAESVKDVTLIKGGFPARYGGRLSSVLDIGLKEGNMKEFHSALSLGLVASSAMVEGPIIEDKVSFIVSGRRTYIDVLARPFFDESDGDGGYFFYDLNGKVNWKISDKDRIYWSIYTGRDKFYFGNNEKYDGVSYEDDGSFYWGNITSALRWNRLWTKNLFSNTTLTYSDYTFGTRNEYLETEEGRTISEQRLSYDSGIRDWAARMDFDYIPSSNHTIRFGGGAIAHTFRPGIFDLVNNSETESFSAKLGQANIPAVEWFLYAENDSRIGPALKVNYGLHHSGFNVGSKTYLHLQPRISARYLLKKDLSLKASFATMRQYINLLSNENIGLPTDLWLPATEKVKPQDSWQTAIGLAQDWRGYEISVEAYYKSMTNLVAYREGSSFFSFDDWQGRVTQGNGTSRGLEFFFQKKTGQWTGWLGYTLSKTDRQFEDLNLGRPFPYKFDRRHDLQIVVNYQRSERFDIGATWVYGTGNAVSLAAETFAYQGPPNGSNFWSSTIDNIEDRNNFRMQAYHRMDIGFNFHKVRKSYKRTIAFGAYNLYNRRNPFFLFTDNVDGQVKLKQASLFPFIPFISYNIRF